MVLNNAEVHAGHSLMQVTMDLGAGAQIVLGSEMYFGIPLFSQDKRCSSNSGSKHSKSKH